MGSLLLLVFLVPLLDLYLLVQIGARLGFLPTLAFTIGTAFVGFHVARREGLRVWSEYQRALQEMRQPSDGVLEGFLVLVGGALLIVPGVLTDVGGLFLLIPWTRRWIGKLARRQFQSHVTVVTLHGSGGTTPYRSSDGSSVIETTGEVADDEPPRRLGSGS